MRSRWIAILFALFFLVFLVDAFRRFNTPLLDPELFLLESKLIYIILSSVGLGALLLFLLVAVAPAIWSRQEGRRNAALAVLREFGKIISATAAAMRRNGHR